MSQTILDILTLILLLGGALLVYFYAIKERIKGGLIIVLLLGLFLRIEMAANPQLHDWDEKYHALVAKNLVKHPLKPTLYDQPVMPTNELDWSSSHIWLSKPPVPLWIMASSIAVFGNTILAIRIPSIILSLLAVYITFLLGKRLFNEKVALMAAFLHAINGLILELAAGKVSSDHVESCFILCVELAIYFVVISWGDKKVYRSIALAGLFTGLAFLSKWFPAFIVFPVWFVGFIFSGKFDWKQFFIQGFLLVGIAALVSIPWILQVNALEDNILERVLFAFAEPVAKHQQPFYYYWHQIMIIFGELVYLPIFFAVYFILDRKWKRSNWLLLAWILIPLIVFTLGETKRYTYMMIAAPAFFLLIANLLMFYTDRYLSSQQRWISAVLITGLLALPVRYSAERMKLFQEKEVNTAFYDQLPEYKNLLKSTDVVFNIKENIELMYLTDVAAAYQYLPAQHQIKMALDQGYVVYILVDNKLLPISDRDL
ncbi:MAG: glycosyltransferase family 39 protein [Crocinitomicaceae bacterium]|nr:glycosyltransferase family 39 protein [Crocinitomicaceae bacterium]